VLVEGLAEEGIVVVGQNSIEVRIGDVMMIGLTEQTRDDGTFIGLL